MYSLSALEKPLPPPAETEKAPAKASDKIQITFSVPKSEANLQSSFVFVEKGSKDVADRPTPREEGPVSPNK
jgi:hypothetical protein